MLAAGGWQGEGLLMRGALVRLSGLAPPMGRVMLRAGKNQLRLVFLSC